MINIIVWDDEEVNIDLDVINTNKNKLTIDSDVNLIFCGNIESTNENFINSINKINKKNEVFLEVRKGFEVKFIPLESIHYFESLKRKVIVHYDDTSIEYYHKFQDLENFVSQHGFLRCHRSFIVNKKKVSKFCALSIFVNNIEIPIGRTYKESIYKELL